MAYVCLSEEEIECQVSVEKMKEIFQRIYSVMVKALRIYVTPALGL